jgi:uroporphyrinogen-III synthase
MIINTRPEVLSNKIISLCADQKISITNAHLSEIQPLLIEEVLEKSKLELSNINSYKNIIFNSQAAAMIGISILLNQTNIKIQDCNIFSIGSATKGLLLKQDINSVSPDEPSSESLLKLISEDYPGRNLIFCGENSNRYLQKNLNEDIDEIICYKLIYLKFGLDKISSGQNIILIYNFLTLSFLLSNINHRLLEDKIFIVASQRIKDKAKELIENEDLRIFIAKDPSDYSMLEEAKKFI